jgi:hypothetical protein
LKLAVDRRATQIREDYEKLKEAFDRWKEQELAKVQGFVAGREVNMLLIQAIFYRLRRRSVKTY